MTVFRQRWPLLAGLFATALVLLLFALAAPGGHRLERPLAARRDRLRLGAAMVVLAIGLGGQILLNARLALRRNGGSWKRRRST